MYDFRVLTTGAITTEAEARNTEFVICAALQFIRYLNEQAGRLKIKGVNMSLSIPHTVRNYACGRTPICKERERLINSGVVVVAAAGNNGCDEANEGKDQRTAPMWPPASPTPVIPIALSRWDPRIGLRRSTMELASFRAADPPVVDGSNPIWLRPARRSAHPCPATSGRYARERAWPLLMSAVRPPC
jgi:hypothetical protein